MLQIVDLLSFCFKPWIQVTSMIVRQCWLFLMIKSLGATQFMDQRCLCLVSQCWLFLTIKTLASVNPWIKWCLFLLSQCWLFFTIKPLDAEPGYHIQGQKLCVHIGYTNDSKWWYFSHVMSVQISTISIACIFSIPVEDFFPPTFKN